MIYSITGLLRQVAPNYCVVEACGVGYRCSASTYTLSSLPGKGQEVTLLTHLWVKEDGVERGCVCTEASIPLDIFTPMREDFVK